MVTSETTLKEFKEITNKPISVITNGYDIGYESKVDLDQNFTISHIGSLLTGRNPMNLWKVLSRIAASDPVFRADLQLEFMGVVSKDVMDSLYRFELGPYIKMKGYGSHAEARRKQRQSQVLLLVEIDSEETKGILPGKLFEYLAAKRPILALGPKGWEAKKIVASTMAGESFDYGASDDLEMTIKQWYKLFKKGKLTIESKNVEGYSRRALTEKLSNLLYSFTAS